MDIILQLGDFSFRKKKIDGPITPQCVGKTNVFLAKTRIMTFSIIDIN